AARLHLAPELRQVDRVIGRKDRDAKLNPHSSTPGPARRRARAAQTPDRPIMAGARRAPPTRAPRRPPPHIPAPATHAHRATAPHHPDLSSHSSLCSRLYFRSPLRHPAALPLSYLVG